MTGLIVVGAICLIIGFAVGALVFRNNPEKGEAVVKKAEEIIEEAKDKVN